MSTWPTPRELSVMPCACIARRPSDAAKNGFLMSCRTLPIAGVAELATLAAYRRIETDEKRTRCDRRCGGRDYQCVTVMPGRDSFAGRYFGVDAASIRRDRRERTRVGWRRCETALPSDRRIGGGVRHEAQASAGQIARSADAAERDDDRAVVDADVLRVFAADRTRPCRLRRDRAAACRSSHSIRRRRSSRRR